MIKQVSDAIFEKIWPTQEWEGSEVVCRAVCDVAARAAIEAMMEPTEAMLEAGDEYIDLGYRDGTGCYQAMIREALK